ncbi:MAG: HTTM domain-containing protein [Nannocystis sp.]|nr:HTTM domain-containing protein [Nannocystis sp.]MBA3549270.1 HTTM domain-containing protein [Nannocystis sp.]
MIGTLGTLALFAADKPPPVDVSAHLDPATAALWGMLALALGFFALRPELWRRLWLTQVDPRPAGLFRIVFGVVVLWTMVDLIPMARFLFTDEGLWLPDMARRNYGGEFRTLWDAGHGFEHWYDWLLALYYRFSLFHIRADPPFVYAVYGAMLVSVTMMILGIKTRISTIVSWFLVNSIYGYSPIFFSGGDTVMRVFLFLGILTRWGEAYSLDTWWRRKRALLAGARELPPLRLIPAWPLRIMMLQLAIIYCATGALKSGHTWMDGTALFFALNLDHFYRHPAQIQLVTFLQMIWALPLATWITRIWEMSFPLALLGAGLRAFERERSAGTWPLAPQWRRLASYLCLATLCVLVGYVAALTALYFYDPNIGPWRISREQAAALFGAVSVALPAVMLGIYLVLRRWRPRWHAFALEWLLGKRLWLGVGVLMHLGIDLLMNVGTFVQVMLAVYIPWLSGAELERVWRTLMSRPQSLSERPAHAKRWQMVLLAPIDRLRHRAPRAAYRVYHNPGEHSVRRAALLRMWDLGERLAFTADPAVAPLRLCVEIPGQARRCDAEAGRALVPVLPGFWWMYPWCLVPGLSRACGWLVLRTFR